MKCNYNCFECPYEDCLLDDEELTPEEIATSEWLDGIAEKENEYDVDLVIRTGKRGRPRKVFPKSENKDYLRKMAKEKYYKHKEERLAYQKAYYAEQMKNPEFRQQQAEKARAYYQNLSAEGKAEYQAKRKEYYKKRYEERKAVNAC